MSYRTLIAADALADLVAQRAVLLFDCRFDLADPGAGRAAYAAGHIPGALYLDLDRDLSAVPNGHNGRHPLPDRHAFADRMAALGLDEGLQVVGYDASGGCYASRLWWLLRWAGHAEAAVLDGGLAAWRDAGLALVAGEERPARRGSFTPVPAPAMPIVDAAQVEANIATDAMLVVDARAAGRYRGEPHPLDPAAGHIPGARNRFFQDNLAATGRFKPPAQLAREFAAVIGDRAPGRIVHQCGSGVTATHNLLAMEVAGLCGARLYPGSWSEWTSDPSRPIATGPI